MKLCVPILLILFILNPLQAFAQHLALGAGITTSSSYCIEGSYITDNSVSFHLGYSTTWSDAKGKKVNAQLWNYGRTVDGQGEFFSSFDLGMGYIIKKSIWLSGEISIGNKSHYIQYLDHRFTGDHYYMIDNDESLFGYGGTMGFFLRDNVVILFRVNTLHKIGIGVRYVF
jgi:hypothetical protein